MTERRHLERRAKPRIARRLSARFGTDAKMAGGTVVDISEGGMRIDASETFPLHSIIVVFVQFPRHAIRLRARVTWCTGKESAKQAMGLTFSRPEPSLIKAYGEWVAEVRQAVKETPPAAAPVGGPDAAPGPGVAPDPGVALNPGAAPDPGVPVPGKSAPPPAREPTGPVRRRLESRNGTIFEALIEPQFGRWRLTVRQLPRPALQDPYDLDREFSSYADAEAALVAFVRSR